jgi:hypothetical protein
MQKLRVVVQCKNKEMKKKINSNPQLSLLHTLASILTASGVSNFDEATKEMGRQKKHLL